MKTIRSVFLSCPIYDSIPDGWKILHDEQNAPNGYIWIWNGFKRFGCGYKKALLREPEVIS